MNEFCVISHTFARMKFPTFHWLIDPFPNLFWLCQPILSTCTSNRIPTRGSSKKGSHVYFLLQVFWVILLFDINVFSDATMVNCCHNSTIWHHNSITMATITRKYTWLPFCYCPLMSILFEVLRIPYLFKALKSWTLIPDFSKIFLAVGSLMIDSSGLCYSISHQRQSQCIVFVYMRVTYKVGWQPTYGRSPFGLNLI